MGPAQQAIIPIRFSPSEAALIKEAAALDRRPVSTWIRLQALRAIEISQAVIESRAANDDSN
jgi:uncharacterized protein (DUF1778 family)